MLNICVPPKSHMLKPNSQYDVIWRQGLWEVINPYELGVVEGEEGGGWVVNGRRAPRGAPNGTSTGCHSACWQIEHQQKMNSLLKKVIRV